jgi:hypothetical protein
MKIRQVKAELFRADGQTQVTKLIVAFHNFAKAPNEQNLISHNVYSDILINKKIKIAMHVRWQNRA